MRLVWTASGGLTTHYNGSVQAAAPSSGGCTVTWVADHLPDEAGPALSAAIEAGMRVMKSTLDRLGGG